MLFKKDWFTIARPIVLKLKKDVAFVFFDSNCNGGSLFSPLPVLV